VVLDCAIFALLGGAIFALRRIRPPVVWDVQGAYHDLERSITKFVPDMPPGFTWGEAVERLRGAGVDIDWPKMESSLADYEAFRYGGREMPKGGGGEVVRLSMKIRGKIVGYRNKREGTRPG
jgi:hypothetical protein